MFLATLSSHSTNYSGEAFLMSVSLFSTRVLKSWPLAEKEFGSGLLNLKSGGWLSPTGSVRLPCRIYLTSSEVLFPRRISFWWYLFWPWFWPFFEAPVGPTVSISFRLLFQYSSSRIVCRWLLGDLWQCKWQLAYQCSKFFHWSRPSVSMFLRI